MPNQSTTLHIFSGLPLWDRFLELTKDQPTYQRMVLEHTNWALPLLDHFINAFPKYTLHNRQHQLNIVRLIGDLLGDNIQQLTGLEAAMLILATVYHDIGMVFNPQQLLQVADEPDFKIFLEAQPEARLQFEEADKIASESLIGWYCRWMHAKRVWPFLDAGEKSTGLPFEWDGIPIKIQLGDLCESHNATADYIRRNDQKFPIEFFGDSDMIFCAILLRLADILDFDDSRTPKSVYEFLRLDQAQSGDDAISDGEWQKHLSSRGFQFKKDNGRLKLLYRAAPKNIKVEIGIRKFIKVINNELDACGRLLRYCSDGWRSFTLPAEINLDGLQSNGYRFGDYHFTLAEDKVMDLLTGDGIYNDEYVFLRELLQNALDTSRHREFRSQASQKGYKAQAIEVSHFIDTEGYQWIRVDDYGMGMNLDIIERHLLKKGESYYNSPLFKLEKLMIKDQQQTEFEPISRFGIGLLSCFMVGDRVEISTTHLDELESGYRLSLETRDGYFMLQSKRERHTASPMPSATGSQNGYREAPGTSIAVRITTNKEYQGFNLKARLSQYLLAPPVPVLYEGVPIGGNFEELLIEPWAETQGFELAKEFVESVAKLTGLKFSNGIQVNILMVDLTNNALTTKLKGQIMVIYINAVPDELTPHQHETASFRLEAGEGTLKLTFTKEFREEGNIRTENAIADLSYVLKQIYVPGVLTKDRFFPHESYHLGGLRISHNGIRIPENDKSIQLDEYIINTPAPWKSSPHYYGSFIASGIIYFQDELLPELIISRNEIKRLPFKIVAHLLTASRQLEQITSHLPECTFNYYKEIDRDIDDTRGAIAASGFYEANRDFWNRQMRVETLDGEFSIADLLKKVEAPVSYYRRHYRSVFYRSLIDYIMETNFDLSCGVKENGNKLYWEHYISKKSIPLAVAADGFDPAIFVTFVNERQLVRNDRNINRDHPYIQWYLSAYPLLREKFDYYAKQLIYMLFNGLYRREQQYEQINIIMDRLRVVLPPELCPPTNLKLTEQDFSDGLGNSWIN